MYKKILTILVFCLFVSGLTGQNIRTKENFNSNWRFFLGQVADAEKSGFNDASWRQLNLPHDWSIEGEFSEKNPASRASLECGIPEYDRLPRQLRAQRAERGPQFADIAHCVQQRAHNFLVALVQESRLGSQYCPDTVGWLKVHLGQ